jgi:NitT/TauT family transport system permease protein
MAQTELNVEATSLAKAPAGMSGGRGGVDIRRVLAWSTLMVERIALGCLAVALWYCLGRFKIVDVFYISTPGDVLHALRKEISDGSLFPNLKSTLEAALLAFALGSSVGISAGLALALLPRFERVVDPYLTAIYSLPRIALAPIFVIVFGLGMSSKVATAVSIVTFMLLLTARAGVKSADRDILLLSQALGANKRQLFVKVLFPVAVPSIFAGLRLGLIYSVLGVVTSEIIASKAGLGQQLLFYSNSFDMAGVYSILLVLAITTTTIQGLMGVLERRIARGQPRSG